MKILIFAHRFEVGGSQVNAIDIAVALRDLHGFEVVIFAEPGPMVEVAEQKGLRFIPAPAVGGYPSATRMRAFLKVIRSERPDLIHAWDWPQCVDAYYLGHIYARVPMIVSHMSMDIDRLLPKSLLTTFGTPEFVDMAKASGRCHVEVLVPPVDVHLNAPDSVDTTDFRARYRIDAGEITLVTVSRVVKWMKAESLARTINAVGSLGREFPLRLIIAGDGDAREDLERLATQTNNVLGRDAVVLTGTLLDPRPAYAAADIVIAMGGSALRGMAFRKPVIVVGEQGFSAPFNPGTAEMFYYRGFYGLADGDPSNQRLVKNIRDLAEHPERFASIGAFSRAFVEERFSVESVTAHFVEMCRATVSRRAPLFQGVYDGLRTAALIAAGNFLSKGVRQRVKALLAGKKPLPATPTP